MNSILDKIKQGSVLHNFGSGWFIYPGPHVPYQKQDGKLVEDDIVKKMEKDGLIKINLKHRSAEAVLN